MYKNHPIFRCFGGIYMKNKNLNYSIFTKYLFSYLILLIIPIFSITFTLSRTTFSALKKEIFENNSASHNIITSSLENELNACTEIAAQINSSRDIRPFTLDNNAIKAINLIDALKKYKVTNNFFDHMFVYFLNDAYIYSENGSYSFNTIFNLFDLKNVNHENFCKQLFSIDHPTFFNNLEITIKQSTKTCTLLTIPLIYNHEIQGFISFLIDNTTLNKILGNNDRVNQKTYLINESNKVLNCTTIDPLLIQELGEGTVENLISSLDENTHMAKLIHGYTLYASKLTNHNLIYLSFTSNQTLFNKVTNIQKTMLITILMTLIIGGFVVFLLLRTNYKPIKDLQTLSSSINTKKSNPTKNELDLIRNTIVELSQRNNELEYELEQNILIRQNFLLNQLINGTIGHLENFLLESEKVQLNLTAKYNGIVVVKSPSPITSISSLFTTMNILNHPFCYEYLIQQLPPNIMIFIVGTEETLNTRFPSILLKDEYVISLSTLYINLMQMSKAYIEARTNLELQLFSGSSIQTQTSLFHTVEKFLQKYENKQRTIQELLDLGDTLSLKIFVTKTTHELQQENMNFELIRNIYLEMIILFNTFFEQNKQLFEYPNVDLTTFFEINNKEILQDMFLEIFEDMIVTMNEKSETDLPVLSVSSIKKSILKNYTDCSFSIQLIAEQFNVSASYLSQYFKEKTGSTILEYMTNLKIEKAKELLKNETLTLKDISQQIGYIHVSSFIRRFKQVTNITPSEYRKQSQ